MASNGPRQQSDECSMHGFVNALDKQMCIRSEKRGERDSTCYYDSVVIIGFGFGPSRQIVIAGGSNRVTLGYAMLFIITSITCETV